MTNFDTVDTFSFLFLVKSVKKLVETGSIKSIAKSSESADFYRKRTNIFIHVISLNCVSSKHKFNGF